MLRSVTFRIEEDLLKLLDEYASMHNLNRSEVIRRAIEKMLKEEFERETGKEIITVARIEKYRIW